MPELITFSSRVGTNANFALSVNDAGHVVGHSLTDDGYRAFYFDGAGPINLGGWGGTNSFGTGINISNLIVGFSESTNGSTAVLFDGQAWNIGNLGGASTYPTGINVSNIVVGDASTTNGETHAFRYDGAGIADLNAIAQTTDFTLISARAINNDGAIVGKGTTNGAEQAFLFTGTNLTAIPLLATATNGEAFALNTQLSVVGTDGTLAGGRAFLWKGGSLYDLNSCIDPSYSGIIREATGINDSGAIVGWASVHGEVHALLLKPNQAPSIAITSPTNGSSFVSPVDFTLTASAADDVSVAKVEFYSSSKLITTKTAAPYTAVLSDVTAGNYAFTAVAYDNLGTTSTSDVVSVTVSLPETGSLKCWLKADTLVLTNGAAVTTWTDSSGNGNNGTGSGANAPTFLTNQIGGLPVIKFDGTNDYLTLPGFLSSATAAEAFIVLKPDGSSSGPLWTFSTNYSVTPTTPRAFPTTSAAQTWFP
jgi:probable HAF family extracellular repeat protein